MKKITTAEAREKLEGAQLTLVRVSRGNEMEPKDLPVLSSLTGVTAMVNTIPDTFDPEHKEKLEQIKKTHLLLFYSKEQGLWRYREIPLNRPAFLLDKEVVLMTNKHWNVLIP